MAVLSVDILDYDSYIEMYSVEYTLMVRSGVSRRTRAFYRNGELTRDNDNKELLEKVSSKVKEFNRKNRI